MTSPSHIEVQLHALRQCNDDKIINILDTKCIIHQYVFFEKTCTLSEYLLELSQTDAIGIKKAQDIISYLSNRNMDEVRNTLAITRNKMDPWKETTGLKIWHSLPEDLTRGSENEIYYKPQGGY